MVAYNQLELVDCQGVAHAVELFPAVVGRSRRADVRIVGDPTVSRIHARFLQSGGMFAIEDLGSLNKTYVQGYQAAPRVPVLLSDGDRLVLSDVSFTVRLRGRSDYAALLSQRF